MAEFFSIVKTDDTNECVLKHMLSGKKLSRIRFPTVDDARQFADDLEASKIVEWNTSTPVIYTRHSKYMEALAKCFNARIMPQQVSLPPGVKPRKRGP